MSFTTSPRAAMDAHTRSDRPAVNYGDSTRLRMHSNATAFLWFDIDKPPGATLVSAVLELWSVGTGWSSSVISARQVNGPWSEGKITDNNKPGLTGTAATSAAITGPGQKASIDVTALVGTGTAWRGLSATVTGAAENRGVASSEYDDASMRPRLVCTWVEDATQPFDLHPTNDNVVATRGPKLTWDWGVAAEDLQDVQVQLDVDGGTFAAPVYDSGAVASTELSFTLPANTLPLTGIRDWRVRIRTSAGTWGAWSDPVGMQYTAMPALAITAPAAGFNTDTPTVTWTFTGQEKAQVTVLDTNGKVLHTSPWLTTALTYAIPEKVIKVTGTYVIRVEAWDTLVRESVAGFPDHAIASVTSTFTFSAGVAGVNTLTGTQPTAQPFVRLTWTRTVTPDTFAIFVDGVKVLTLPGSTLTYDLWQGFVLGKQQLFEVMAGVGTPPLYSASNIDAFVTPRGSGAWFWRESDGAIAQVLNEDAPYSFEDDTAFLQPVNSPYPVAIGAETHSMAMAFSGVVTSQAYRATLESMVRSDESVRALVGDMNVLAQLTGLSVEPGPSGSWDVGFAITQVGA